MLEIFEQGGFDINYKDGCVLFSYFTARMGSELTPARVT